MSTTRINMRDAERAGAEAIRAATGIMPMGVTSQAGVADTVRIVAFRTLKNTSTYADCMVDLITGRAGDVRPFGTDRAWRDAQ